MTPGKIAAQAVHAAIGLGGTDPLMTVVVLGVSCKKFAELTCVAEGCYVHVDSGYTEVEPGTATCAAWFEE